MCKEGEKQPKCTFIIQKTFNQCRQIQIKRILVRGGLRYKQMTGIASNPGSYK